MSDLIVLLDESANGEVRRGGPPPIERNERVFCPKCLSEEVYSGYGLAYGGMGSYWNCEDCDWFYKEMDTDES